MSKQVKRIHFSKITGQQQYDEHTVPTHPESLAPGRHRPNRSARWPAPRCKLHQITSRTAARCYPRQGGDPSQRGRPLGEVQKREEEVAHPSTTRRDVSSFERELINEWSHSSGRRTFCCAYFLH